MKIKIKEAIIVEGRYDVNTVRQLFDTSVIATEGFGIYKRKDVIDHLRRLAAKDGIIILTDGDGAGFQIRSLIKGSVNGRVLNAYIPDIAGKEKRKKSYSSEGKLGVEGMRSEIIIEAVKRAGATIQDADEKDKKSEIERSALYEDGFFGKDNSAEKRKKLCKLAMLPERMNVNSLLEALNMFYGKEGYEELKLKIDEEEK